jgi:hypothetical protein
MPPRAPPGDKQVTFSLLAHFKHFAHVENCCKSLKIIDASPTRGNGTPSAFRAFQQLGLNKSWLNNPSETEST